MPNRETPPDRAFAVDDVGFPGRWPRNVANVVSPRWWAHDAIEEKKAFEGFIDWAYGQWLGDRSMHIYHYAGYEVTAMRRLILAQRRLSVELGEEVGVAAPAVDLEARLVDDRYATLHGCERFGERVRSAGDMHQLKPVRLQLLDERLLVLRALAGDQRQPPRPFRRGHRRNLPCL